MAWAWTGGSRCRLKKNVGKRQVKEVKEKKRIESTASVGVDMCGGASRFVFVGLPALISWLLPVVKNKESQSDHCDVMVQNDTDRENNDDAETMT
jgi:hypothetical protein